MNARSVAKPRSRILASRTTKQGRVLTATRRDGGTAGAFRRRNPLQYSRYCCGFAPRTASRISVVAPTRNLFRGSLAGSSLPKRRALVQFIEVVRDSARFPCEKAFDRGCEVAACDPVRRTRFDGEQTAGHLVLALCAAFERLEAACDAVFDHLVIASFEVQHRVMLDRTPITAVQALGVAHVERRRDRPSCAGGDHHHDALGHGDADASEEFEIEVRCRMVLAIRSRVAPIEESPLRVGDL